MLNECPKCKGTKRIMKANGVIQPCWDCLNAGKMDQHDGNLKDAGIKL